MLELYYFPTSTCALKARLTLEEKGVDYSARVLDRNAGDLNTPEYRGLNPEGVVPTLVHDGIVFVESSVIMRYIDDAFDGPDLLPVSPVDRASVNLWMKRADESYLPAVGSLTYAVFGRHSVLQKSPDELTAYYDAILDPVRRARRKSVVENGLDSPAVVPALKVMFGMVELIDEALSSNNWIAGPSWSLADAALTPFVERLIELGVPWLNEHTAIDNWWQRITSRRSYQVTAEAQRDEARAVKMRAYGHAARDQLTNF